MSDETEQDTQPGHFDDSAVKRVKKNKKKKKDMLQEIFDDNTTSRYSKPTDD